MAYVSSGIWSLVPDTCASRVDPSTATDEESEQFYNRWSNFVASLMVDSTVGAWWGAACKGTNVGCLALPTIASAAAAAHCRRERRCTAVPWPNRHAPMHAGIVLGSISAAGCALFCLWVRAAAG